MQATYESGWFAIDRSTLWVITALTCCKADSIPSPSALIMQPFQLPTLTVGPGWTKEVQSAPCWKVGDPLARHATSEMLATQYRYTQRLGRGIKK
ncbi:hypothetical protein M419DRAFT_123598 [Trichoderma reesei RUT C-30]|uniref:Uncharacterized protein n=1 Tax=Hypocrea jecorina (strain ATCC 56765 / BCRC 32924 / NRRL 11460 / Rut C-30) TaxID=1344414 RepID=A0A024S7J3_HYPJR|nr:hypothetical protein M419DRAFT_123598 [Trichoderma reesei RUT C-30]